MYFLLKIGLSNTYLDNLKIIWHIPIAAAKSESWTELSSSLEIQWVTKGLSLHPYQQWNRSFYEHHMTAIDRFAHLKKRWMDST
jgi:hypothetical protein